MDSHQNHPPEEARLHFLDYWRIIRIRKAIIITVFLITAIIATAVTFILPASYSSTAQVEIKEDHSVLPENGMSGSPSSDPVFLTTELEKIKGPVVLTNVVVALNLNDLWGKKYGVGTLKTSETVVFLQGMISLSPVRNTTLVDITVYNADKDEAALIANTIATAYKNYRIEQQQSQTKAGIEELKVDYQTQETEITNIQAKVDMLRTNLGINDLDPHSFTPTPSLDTEALRRLQEKRQDAETTYNGLKTQLERLKALNPEKLRDVLPTMSNPDSELNSSIGKLNEAKQKYAKLTTDMTTNNPVVITAQAEIMELSQQIDARVSGIMVGMENNLETKKAELQTMIDEVARAATKDQEAAARGAPYWEAKRDLANKEDLHKILGGRIENAVIDLHLPKDTTVTITKHGEPGKDPVRPNKPLNIALGLIFGLIVGIGLAFFIEYLDTSVKTIDDVERAFQAPVLGVIPQSVGILADEGPESRYAEAYRVLRTNILFARKDEKFSTIVVVSAGAGEGKSTTTLNLATVFAQASQRVLVVDSDLRRPTLHKLLHVANDLGLTNYLLKQNTLSEVIQTTAVPTLHFMASGKLPSSSMSILNSEHMKAMIAELKQRYDFIFFDSPPILGVSDASVLASEVDMVAQVIQYRRYPQPMNLRAKQVIEKVGGTFIGIILNNINMSQDESYYYYSGYYHDYYYSGSAKEQEAAASKNPGDAGRVGIKQKY